MLQSRLRVHNNYPLPFILPPSSLDMELLVPPGDGIGPEITDATLAVLVRDLGGPLGTRAFAERVAGHLV